MVSLSALSAPVLVTTTNMFLNCFSLASIDMINSRVGISFNNTKLAKEALETFFTNVSATTTAQTLTITNTVGSFDGIVGPLAGTPVNGSTVIAMPSTSSILTGMQVTGINTSLTTGRTVRLSAVGSLVDLPNHGLSNNDEISFPVIFNTTGIVVNTIYYVTNATTNNFQVAALPGGAPLTLTPTGSGAVKYNATVASITANTGITLTRPMSGNGASQQLSFRSLQTYRAVLKGYTIAG
jgi:hypothetical protein